MTGQQVTFDGHLVNSLFYVGEPDVGLPGFEPDATERVGADGAALRGTRVTGYEISVPLVAKPNTGMTPREAISTLLSWLDVDGLRRLVLSGDEGLFRMAVPTGAPRYGGGEWGDHVTVTFLQPDPWLYGAERAVTVPSGGSVTVDVGGDRPTRPTVQTSAAKRSSSTLTWGLLLDSATRLRFALASSAATVIVADCDARTCTVAGATSVPTLDSDWMQLTPGQHVIRNDQGTGASTVTWLERWHR